MAVPAATMAAVQTTTLIAVLAATMGPTTTTLMAVPAATMVTVPTTTLIAVLAATMVTTDNYADGCTCSYDDACTDN
jgi:hypothetical protein